MFSSFSVCVPKTVFTRTCEPWIWGLGMELRSSALLIGQPTLWLCVLYFNTLFYLSITFRSLDKFITKKQKKRRNQRPFPFFLA